MTTEERKTRKLKLTNKVAMDLPIQPFEYFVWDTELTGFGLRIYPSGRRVLIAQVRIDSKQRRETLGKLGDLTVDQARQKAKTLISQARLGLDPGAEKSDNPTLRQCYEIWLAEAAQTHRKTGAARSEASIANDVSRMTVHVLPRIGHLRLTDIQRHHVDDILKQAKRKSETYTRPLQGKGFVGRTGGPAAGKRVVATLKSVLAYAVDRRWISHNPATGVPLPADKSRLEYLTADEANQLISVINNAISTSGPNIALDIIRLLLYTGCRRSEIESLLWSEVDLHQRVLNLSKSKTGARKVPLNDHAIAILEAQSRQTSPYVFPSPSNASSHFKSLRRTWRRLRAQINRCDCDLHSLRHTYATLLVSSGTDLFTIGKILGHRKNQTTSIYAHLVDEPVKDANKKAKELLIPPVTFTPKEGDT